MGTTQQPLALDDVIVDLARRMGRRGVNEAAVWTLLRGSIRGVMVDECATAVRRLVASGRLYRNHRRTRTMLIAPVKDHTQPAAPDTTDEQTSLFDDDDTNRSAT